MEKQPVDPAVFDLLSKQKSRAIETHLTIAQNFAMVSLAIYADYRLIPQEVADMDETDPEFSSALGRVRRKLAHKQGVSVLISTALHIMMDLLKDEPEGDINLEDITQKAFQEVRRFLDESEVALGVSKADGR
jgi:hypothetical protein